MITEAQVARMFEEGFDCSQIVLSEVSGRLGITKEEAFGAAACFGIGMAQGSVCGAAGGAFIAIGIRYGNTKPGDFGAKQKAFDVRDEFVRRFREMNGDLMCPDFLGQRVCSLEDMMIAKPSGVFDKCPRYCVNAIRILEELL